MNGSKNSAHDKTLRIAATMANYRLAAEKLLKVFFADHGTEEDLLATIAAIREWAEAQVARNTAVCRKCRPAIRLVERRGVPLRGRHSRRAFRGASWLFPT